MLLFPRSWYPSPIAPAAREWMLHVAKCFFVARRDGGASVTEYPYLVLPTGYHLPSCRMDNPNEWVQELFDAVRFHAGLAHWPARVTPVDGRHENFPTRAHYPGLHPPPRTFTYDASMGADDLVTQFASHMAGWWLERYGPDALAPDATTSRRLQELIAVLMGFGLFVTRAALLRPHSESSPPGLGPTEAVYALALFCQVTRTPLRRATPHLSRDLRLDLRAAYRSLRTSQHLHSASLQPCWKRGGEG
ncbi:hypothetical protein TK90_2794 (plasmid) [Thioalkalivibrio sp. K90mix]|nr:hypothetical protein TK90_2794 [Thioalkalivibrio sp. K90mix]